MRGEAVGLGVNKLVVVALGGMLEAEQLICVQSNVPRVVARGKARPRHIGDELSPRFPVKP